MVSLGLTLWTLVTIAFEVLALVQLHVLGGKTVQDVQPMYVLAPAAELPGVLHFSFVCLVLAAVRFMTVLYPRSSGAFLRAAPFRAKLSGATRARLLWPVVPPF